MTKKEKAARKAAAKYSSNLVFAVLEYGALSGQIMSIALTNGYEKLRDEMLSMLPRYRHPTANEIAECILFFDPEAIKLRASGYEVPSFIDMLEKKGIADHLITGIKEYVRESELRKIELAQCLKLKQKFLDAERTYADCRGEKRIDERNAEVVKKLGLSSSRGRPPKFDSNRMWVDYVTLVRKGGLSLYRAVQEVKKKHRRKSKTTTTKALHEQRASLLGKIEQQYPEMYDKAKECLTGLVPTRRND